MGIGSFTQGIDLAQVVLYVFWIFFFGLIYYLRREDKREGYPLESDRSANAVVQGFPPVPPPKIFKLRNGSTYSAPPGTKDSRPIRAQPVSASQGSPLQPLGDPMLDAVGPASWAEREDVPDLTAEGENKIVPLRVAHDFFVAKEDPDPRGMSVSAADGSIGKVVELWIDRSEPQIRYLEVMIAGGPGRSVLLPINFARIDKRRGRVRVVSLFARHFANVPPIANRDSITLREEDRITAYYAGGHLYAEPARLGPLV